MKANLISIGDGPGQITVAVHSVAAVSLNENELQISLCNYSDENLSLEFDNDQEAKDEYRAFVAKWRAALYEHE
jgi:hypothetical protein